MINHRKQYLITIIERKDQMKKKHFCHLLLMFYHIVTGIFKQAELQMVKQANLKYNSLLQKYSNFEETLILCVV